MSGDNAVLLAPQPPSQRKVLRGVALSVLSQLGWGLYPVFARALQTQEPHLELPELMLMLNALSAAELSTVALLRRAMARRPPPSAVRGVTTSCPSIRMCLMIGCFATVILVRATTNLASAAYAPAHWCVMLNLCTPVFTATIGRLVFRDPLPEGTVAALAVGLSGSALAIFGGVRGDSSHHHEASPLLALGLGLALGSAFALAIYQHIVKRTKGLLSENFVLSLNYFVVLVPSVVILGVQQAQGSEDLLGTLHTLSARQWVLLLLFSSVVYLGANLAQQLAIRSLGPTLVSAVMPLRLISSVAGSYVLLGEGIASVAEAAGLALSAFAATAYLGRQVVLSRRREARLVTKTTSDHVARTTASAEISVEMGAREQLPSQANGSSAIS